MIDYPIIGSRVVRDLREDERDKFGLWHYGRIPIMPTLTTTGVIWYPENLDPNLPVYSFYPHGTGSFVTLRYTVETDTFEKIELEEVATLRYIFWLFLISKDRV